MSEQYLKVIPLDPDHDIRLDDPRLERVVDALEAVDTAVWRSLGTHGRRQVTEALIRMDQAAFAAGRSSHEAA